MIDNDDELVEGLQTEDEKAALRQIVAEWTSKGASPTAEALVAADYEADPVDVKTFIEDPYFLDLRNEVWPVLLDDLVEFFHEGAYLQAVLKGAIGWGKSTFVELAMLYMVYRCSCLRDPQRYYSLMRGSTIAFVNVSVSKKKARQVVFGGIKSKIRGSPYFQEAFVADPYTTSELRFPKDIWLAPMATVEQDVLGLNVYGGSLDESNFMPLVERSRMIRTEEVYDAAKTLYNAIARRLQSRFNLYGRVPGKILVVSSSQYPDDFTERKAREALDDPTIFVRSYAQWETKPRNFFLPETFQVEVGDEVHRSRVLVPDMAQRPGAEVLEVPLDFKPLFEKDPDGAVRDIAGRTIAGVEPFIKNREAIAAAIDPDRQHPFPSEELVSGSGFPLNVEALCVQENGVWRPRWHPGVPRSVHIDLGLTRDSTGVAVGCSPSRAKVLRQDAEGAAHEDVAPVIWYDLLLAIVPPPGGEIDIADIRRLLYRMIDLGFPIRKVTFDSFESAESIQQWTARGISSGILSVDADMRAYEALKQALYENRVRYYAHRVLMDELRLLQHDRRRKRVDHPQLGAKDLADAAAGVAFHWTFDAPKEPRMRILGEGESRRSQAQEEVNLGQAWDGMIRQAMEIE